MKSDKRLTRTDLTRSPASFFALGFGAGLAPFAPGTVGTLPGIALYLICSNLAFEYYLSVVVVAFVGGVWICSAASAELGTHDHGGIVWDEIVGYLVTMLAVPFAVGTVVAGFVLFRLFDIVKPWPISWIDKEVHGGFGIMLDDVLAGLMACLCLHLLLNFVPGLVAF